MDISGYISDLLFEQDCIIIPGFGGFVCSYKPADIHPVQNTIAPPAKAITFNRHLQTNDGLLINHFSTKNDISFLASLTAINEWVNASKSLLNNGEVITLHKIGRFYLDIEKNLQFEADSTVNYLKSSYGLKTITALPVFRGKEVSLHNYENVIITEKPSRKKILRIAAIAALLVMMAGLTQLIWTGVEIKSLQLNEAGMVSFMNHIFKTPEADIKPLEAEIQQPLHVEETPVAANVEEEATQPVVTEKTAPAVIENVAKVADGPSPKFYIIIGAFKEAKNVEMAKERLQQKFPGGDILTESKNGLIKVGYYAGNNHTSAKEQLTSAQEENASYWLLKK